MRKWDWTTHRLRADRIQQSMRRAGLTQRQARTRPRHPDEMRVLIRHSVAHICRAQAEGRFEKIGERQWRLRWKG